MVTAGVRHPPLVQSMFSPEQQGHTHGHSLHGACGRYRHILPEGRWMRKQGLSGTGNPVLLYEMSKTLLPEGTGAPEDVDYQSGSGDPEARPGLIVDEQQPQGLTHSCILTKTDSRGRIQNSTIINSRKINDPIKKWAKELDISPNKTYRWLTNT